METTKQCETINGISYFRFSGRLDKIHLHAPYGHPLKKSTGSICGKPSLSSNYAQYKSNEEICPDCLTLAKNYKNETES